MTMYLLECEMTFSFSSSTSQIFNPQSLAIFRQGGLTEERSPHRLIYLLTALARRREEGLPMSHTSPQNATSEENLTPAQEKALAALLAGQTVTAAAKAANVDRTTVYRWLRHPDDRAFYIALERGRRELRFAMRARLLALLPMAADCLETALALGDGKTALALMKGLGFLPGPPRPE
jgi:hypothetical protein